MDPLTQASDWLLERENRMDDNTVAFLRQSLEEVRKYPAKEQPTDFSCKDYAQKRFEFHLVCGSHLILSVDYDIPKQLLFHSGDFAD